MVLNSNFHFWLHSHIFSLSLCRHSLFFVTLKSFASSTNKFIGLLKPSCILLIYALKHYWCHH
ncbi:hypothetical protein E2C01_047918 [Portunus trituberculatus]|uniref:Uncharacterized protein n=1 Tax=Portunus trituberculatus TaxID=210409 RepID=A0A5B7G4W0_PORTR|nr:hypothetical protein [Portunus trituberculatus]